MPARRLGADWVVPIEGPPIRRGAVLVDAEGRIAAVGRDAEVPSPSGTDVEWFTGGVLLPGLVNAHTHLELTGFDGLVGEDDFPAWIRQLIALKSERTPGEFLAAARRGVADCHAAGVTTVADTGDSGTVIQALHEAGGSGIAYLEVFGPHPDQAPGQLAALEARVAALRRFETARVRMGVSPHAPYSVSGPLYQAVAGWARKESLPIAVHLAESAAESALLEEASGAFAALWAARGIPLPALPGRSPVAWLDAHGVLGDTTLCIHVVRANRDDLRRLERHRCGIAHCPRSNRRHDHGDAPLAAFLDAGLRVGVGTDSVASVSPLDLLAEARGAAALAGLDAGRALELCTIGAARAIGLGAEVGGLRAGKWGDAVALTLPEGVDESRLLDTVLTRERNAVMATFVAGRAVFRRAA
jgi:5-methylthioadenosine/S-adenosylhomocysteine deaminase